MKRLKKEVSKRRNRKILKQYMPFSREQLERFTRIHLVSLASMMGMRSFDYPGDLLKKAILKRQLRWMEKHGVPHYTGGAAPDTRTLLKVQKQEEGEGNANTGNSGS